MKKMKLREYIILFLLLVLVGSNSFSQDMKKKERTANADMRQGNIFYQEEVYPDAEVSYKKAITENPNKPKAVYNLANTMMQQERYKEAVMQYDHLIKNKSTETEKAPTFHNIGNANMSLKDYEKAIEAYKNSLRKNPNDEETRYNLALAQQFLKQQQKNDQNKDDKNQNKQDDKKNQDEKKNQNKEKKDNKENQDKDKKEDDNQNKNEEKDKGDKDKKDNNEDEDKNKSEKEKGESQDDRRNPQDEEKNKNQQAQPQPGKLSPQQIRQLLEALNNEEKKTHDKINAKKVKGRPVKTEKDW